MSSQVRLNNQVIVKTTQVFLGTGSIQSFTVPADVYWIRFFLWGAGGNGHGGQTRYLGSAGGSGAYVEGNFKTAPGTVFSIIVGRVGQSGLANGGGSTGGPSGGGFTGIFLGSPSTSTVVAIAGGGGGSGFNGFFWGLVSNGGGGGYPAGGSAYSTGGGTGGTQTAGGTPVSGATAGAQLAGGTGVGGDNGGGGGGGGWWGGGGGNSQQGAGGGSSTYISSVMNPVTVNGIDGYTITNNGDYTPAANESSPYWVSPYGRSGNNGYAVIGYNLTANSIPLQLKSGVSLGFLERKYSALFNNSSLSIPANSALTLGTNNHTIEFWMYQTSRGQYDNPFIYGNTVSFATNNYYFSVGNYLGFVIGNGAGNWAINLNGGTATDLNVWNHYAIVRNGTTFTLYVNGISRASQTSSINIAAQGDVFRIGDYNSSGTYPINGYITNFRLVNGTAVYTSNFTPSTEPLTAIPNTQVLIQGLVDNSPNAFTVTNTNATLSRAVSPFNLIGGHVGPSPTLQITQGNVLSSTGTAFINDNTTYTFPANVTKVRVFIWGGGGGNRGGSGAHVAGDIVKGTMTTLTIYVNRGRGLFGPGGGVASGGFGAVYNSTNGYLMIAGAGGTGSGSLFGGGGGYLQGFQAGSSILPSSKTINRNYSNGGGGSQTQGGQGGYGNDSGNYISGAPGGYLQGGDGNRGSAYGQGGGGGYYGGGGGNGDANGGGFYTGNGAGGGGSSYINPGFVRNYLGEDGKNGSSTSVTPGGTSSPFYQAGYGVGALSGAGGNALVVIVPYIS